MVTRVDDDIAWISFLGSVVLKWQGLCPGQETKCPQRVVKLGGDLKASKSRGRRKFRTLFSSSGSDLGPLFMSLAPALG